MEFALKNHDGHYGPRKFWHNHLPRLKYHNPAVSMTVSRTTDNAGPATMTVFYAPAPESASATASPAPSSSTTSAATTSGHTPFERVESIDMKHKHETEILEKLMRLTKAMQVVATAEEDAELQALEDQRQRSEADRKGMAEVNERKRREKSILEQARGGLATTKAA